MTQGARTAAFGSFRTLWDAGAIGRMTDAQLLEGFLTRPEAQAEAAFTALVERHGPVVRRVCLDVLGDPHEAQDASQATFLVLARRARSIRKPESLGPWLHGVALRVARKARAGAARRRAVERRRAEIMAERHALGSTGGPDPCPELHEEIDRLPEKYRAPIVLCYLQGHTQERAAEALGWPLGTVQTRLHRGRQRLGVRLARRGIVPAGVLAADLATPASATAVAVPPGWAEATARASVRFAARGATAGMVATPVVRLAERVLARMARDSFKALALGALSVGLAAAGMATGPRTEDHPHAEPRAEGARAKALREDSKAPPKVSALKVHGVVVDEADRPVPGAVVRVVHPSSAIDRVETAGDGTFSLPLVVDEFTAQPRVAMELHASAEGDRLQGRAEIAGRLTAAPPKPTRIVVRPARSVTVHVEDADGRPVPGADVEALAFGNSPSLMAGRTNAEGSVQLLVAKDMMVPWIVALKAGVGCDFLETYRTWPPPSGTALAPPERARLVLDGARTVSVQVVDPSRKPVPGVTLSPLWLGKPGRLTEVHLTGSRIANATTGQDGVATFAWIPKTVESPLGFQVTSKEFQREDSGLSFDPTGDRPAFTMVVARLMSVSGRVVGPDGIPMAGIPIQAEGYGNGPARPRQVTLTGDDGTYAFELPPRRHYVLAVTSAEWAARSHTGIFLEERRPRSGLDFRLSRGTILRGRVTDPDGKPAARKPLVLRELDRRIPDEPGRSLWGDDWVSLSRMGILTDADGRYETRVGPGTFLVFTPFDLAADGKAAERGTIKVEDQAVIERDVRTKSRSAPEAPYQTAFMNTPFRITFLTPISGTTPGSAQASLTGTIKSLDGRPTVGLGSTRVPLTGVIKGLDGRPAVGAFLSAVPLRRSSSDSSFQSIADDAGRFRADRDREPLFLYARSADGRSAAARRVEAAEDTVEVTLSPSATVRGRILDAQGRPQAGVSVQCGWGLESFGVTSGEGPMSMSASGKTDDQGRYAFDGLPVGVDGRVSAVQKGQWSGDRRFRVEKDGPLEVEDFVVNQPVGP